jgi:hypothetical protein
MERSSTALSSTRCRVICLKSRFIAGHRTQSFEGHPPPALIQQRFSRFAHEGFLFRSGAVVHSGPAGHGHHRGRKYRPEQLRRARKAGRKVASPRRQGLHQPPLPHALNSCMLLCSRAATPQASRSSCVPPVCVLGSSTGEYCAQRVGAERFLGGHGSTGTHQERSTGETGGKDSSQQSCRRGGGERSGARDGRCRCSTGYRIIPCRVVASMQAAEGGRWGPHTSSGGAWRRGTKERRRKLAIFAATE